MRAALLALLAAGCHAHVTEIRWTYVDRPARIDHVVVVERIQHSARIGVLMRGFERRLQSRLEECHVATTIEHAHPDDADTRTRLVIEPSVGEYTMVSSRNDEDITTKLDGDFKLELFDERAGKVTWRAVINVTTSSTPDLGDGEELADTALASLHDAAIVACP